MHNVLAKQTAYSCGSLVGFWPIDCRVTLSSLASIVPLPSASNFSNARRQASISSSVMPSAILVTPGFEKLVEGDATGYSGCCRQQSNRIDPLRSTSESSNLSSLRLAAALAAVAAGRRRRGGRELAP